MKFKQDYNLYINHILFVVVSVFLSLIMVCILRNDVGFWMMILLLIAVLFSYIPCKKMIEINEEGISCEKKGKLFWRFKWEEIAELKKGVRYNHPSIEIITYNRFGEPEQAGKNNHYFLWNKKSKEALNKYYSGTITKRTYWKNKH